MFTRDVTECCVSAGLNALALRTVKFPLYNCNASRVVITIVPEREVESEAVTSLQEATNFVICAVNVVNIRRILSDTGCGLLCIFYRCQ